MSENEDPDYTDSVSIYATPLRNRKRPIVNRHQDLANLEGERQRIDIVISSPNRNLRASKIASNMQPRTYERWQNTTSLKSIQQPDISVDHQDAVSNLVRIDYDDLDQSNELDCQSPVSTLESNSGFSAKGSDQIRDSCESSNFTVTTKRSLNPFKQTSSPIKLRQINQKRFGRQPDQSVHGKSPQGYLGEKVEQILTSGSRTLNEKLNHESFVRSCQNCSGASRKIEPSHQTQVKVRATFSDSREGLEQRLTPDRAQTSHQAATTLDKPVLTNEGQKKDPCGMETSKPAPSPSGQPETHR